VPQVQEGKGHGAEEVKDSEPSPRDGGGDANTSHLPIRAPTPFDPSSFFQQQTLYEREQTPGTSGSSDGGYEEDDYENQNQKETLKGPDTYEVEEVVEIPDSVPEDDSDRVMTRIFQALLRRGQCEEVEEVNQGPPVPSTPPPLPPSSIWTFSVVPPPPQAFMDAPPLPSRPFALKAPGLSLTEDRSLNKGLGLLNQFQLLTNCLPDPEPVLVPTPRPAVSLRPTIQIERDDDPLSPLPPNSPIHTDTNWSLAAVLKTTPRTQGSNKPMKAFGSGNVTPTKNTGTHPRFNSAWE
jgi:hypothetical protein